LRGLQSLEAAPEQPASAPSGLAWGARYAVAFLGLMVVLFSLVFAGYLQSNRRALFNPDEIRSEVEALAPADAWVEMWHVAQSGPERHLSPLEQSIYNEQKSLGQWVNVGLAAAALGALVAAVALALGRRKPETFAAPGPNFRD
jgi:hypothetical protein